MRLWMCSLLFGTALTLVGASAAEAQGELTWSEIHSTLDPHGTWVEVGEYGQAWRPTGVRTSWRPYTEGHWEKEGEEWLWVSDFSWGRVPFHYGRWSENSNFGWVWIPGFEYAPSWTVWREVDTYSAWAPLPPGPCWEGEAFVGAVPSGGWVYTPRAVFRSRIVYFRPLFRAPHFRGQPVHRAYGPYVNPRRVRAYRAGHPVRGHRAGARVRAYRAGRRVVPGRRPPPARGVVYSRGNVGPRGRHAPARHVDPRRRIRSSKPGGRVHRSGRGAGGSVVDRRAHPRRNIRSGGARRIRPGRVTPSVRRAAPRSRTVKRVNTRGGRKVYRARTPTGRGKVRSSYRRRN